MTDKIITFARHGNTFNKEDTPIQIGLNTDLELTAKGLEQAHKLGEHFKVSNYTITKIYHGMLKRQTTAAQIISTYINNTNPQINNAFDEIDYGSWEAKTQNEIMEKWPNQYKEWEEQLIWQNEIFGSKQEDHLKRLEKFINNFKKSEDNHILVVSSQGLIKLVLHLIRDMHKNITKTHNGRDYKVKTGNYCQVSFGKSENTIISWNTAPV
jgi:alpha-ribazole phosphatase